MFIFVVCRAKFDALESKLITHCDKHGLTHLADMWLCRQEWSDMPDYDADPQWDE